MDHIQPKFRHHQKSHRPQIRHICHRAMLQITILNSTQRMEITRPSANLEQRNKITRRRITMINTIRITTPAIRRT